MIGDREREDLPGLRCLNTAIGWAHVRPHGGGCPLERYTMPRLSAEELWELYRAATERDAGQLPPPATR